MAARRRATTLASLLLLAVADVAVPGTRGEPGGSRRLLIRCAAVRRFAAPPSPAASQALTTSSCKTRPPRDPPPAPRPMPGTALTCRNTLLGPWMYADDKGLLCKAGELDHKSGCCRGGDKHSCST